MGEVKSLSHVRLFATPQTVAYRLASPSLGFSRQEYQSGLPFPSPRDLPNPGIEPRSPALHADAPSSKGQLQTVAYQGRERMKKQRRSSQETMEQPLVRVLTPPQGMDITTFEFFCRN